jgi:hypothetical protein
VRHLVRRLHSYYVGVRLPAFVHHRLQLLAFPMRTGGSRPSGRTRDLPVSDAVPLHVMCSSTPAGRLVPRIAALLVLRSTTTTASAPAMRQFRGSIDTPCNCCVRFVAVVTEAHATLATERPATAFSGRSSTGWTAPAKLTPSVLVSRAVITYSAPSVPLAGTAQLHRTATYMCCLSCAGAPRPPASGSGLYADRQSMPNGFVKTSTFRHVCEPSARFRSA